MSARCLCVSVVNCLSGATVTHTPDPASAPADVAPAACPCRPGARGPSPPSPPRPPTPDWAFDVLKLKNGVVHKGLLLEEGPTGVRFQIIRRLPGRPTVWLTVAFKKDDVGKLEKLTDDERAALKAKLEEIDPSPEAEARRADKIDLKPSTGTARRRPGCGTTRITSRWCRTRPRKSSAGRRIGWRTCTRPTPGSCRRATPAGPRPSSRCTSRSKATRRRCPAGTGSRTRRSTTRRPTGSSVGPI